MDYFVHQKDYILYRLNEAIQDGHVVDFHAIDAILHELQWWHSAWINEQYIYKGREILDRINAGLPERLTSTHKLWIEVNSLYGG